MQYPKVIVNGVSVRVDSEGRYSLNDLHAAAVLKGEASGHGHTKEFSYKYAASIITAVSVGEKDATVSIKTKDGSVFDTSWPLDAFFNKKPSVGKWLVDGHFGERFVVSESELSKLGNEITDEAAD